MQNEEPTHAVEAPPVEEPRVNIPNPCAVYLATSGPEYVGDSNDLDALKEAVLSRAFHHGNAYPESDAVLWLQEDSDFKVLEVIRAPHFLLFEPGSELDAVSGPISQAIRECEAIIEHHGEKHVVPRKDVRCLACYHPAEVAATLATLRTLKDRLDALEIPDPPTE